MGLEQTQDKTHEGLMEIYYTSDTHSYVYPTDYVSREDKATGYMVLSSMFKDDALKIDGGDVLQGSPLVRFEMKRGNSPLMAAKAFNAAGLDVFVPGNHDFDFGYETLRSFTASLDAEVVCANLQDEKGLLKIRPYAVIEKNGVKVFVTGAVTDYVNVWDKDKLSGLRITDSVNALKTVLKEKDAAAADFRICVYHGGFGNESGSLKENRAGEIAELGFDILLTAHQHQIIKPYYIHDSLLTLQAGSKASCCAHIRLEKGKKPEAEIIYPEKDFQLNDKMKKLREHESRLETDLENYLDRKAGEVDGILEDRSRIYSFVHGSSLADYINDIQLSITGADISAASLFNTPVSLSHEVSMKDILQAYPFSNTLVTADITGGQLKTAMERSASFVDFRNGEFVEAEDFAPGKDERYNYDFYRGVSYTFDLSEKKGQRVKRLIWKNIDLLQNPETEMRIVLNSYRASGTGGYDVYRTLKNSTAISVDIQDALIASFENRVVEVPSKTDFSVKI